MAWSYDYFCGEIRAFAFANPPDPAANWAPCTGGTIPVAQNGLLYAIIGNSFGGDSQNIGLPDLQGAIPIGCGDVDNPGTAADEAYGLLADPEDDPVGSTYGVATFVGTPSVTLTPETGVPGHRHQLLGLINEAPFPGSTSTPAANSWLSRPMKVNSGSNQYYLAPAFGQLPAATVACTSMLLPFGSATVEPHENRQPYLALNFCIAVIGTPIS